MVRGRRGRKVCVPSCPPPSPPARWLARAFGRRSVDRPGASIASSCRGRGHRSPLRLAARLAAPRRFHLEDNLRCPSRIAGVIERASEWYVHLDKSRRPTKQRHQQGGQHVDAHLLHVVADVPTAVGLLERLDEVERLVVITVADEKPAWVPERLRDMVLTPADAKGLEYQSVCVLDPGRVLAQLEDATRVDDHGRIAGAAGAGAPNRYRPVAGDAEPRYRDARLRRRGRRRGRARAERGPARGRRALPCR